MILIEVVRGLRAKRSGAREGDQGPIGQGFLGLLIPASDAPASAFPQNTAVINSQPEKSCTNWAFSRQLPPIRQDNGRGSGKAAIVGMS